MGAGSSAGLPFSASTIDIYSSLPEQLSKEQCIKIVGIQTTENLWAKYVNSSRDKTTSGVNDCISRERLLTLSTIGTLNQKDKKRNFRSVVPKIYFLDYKAFQSAGAFPRFDPANPALRTIDEITHSKVFIVFISHAWITTESTSQDSPRDICTGEITHPDTADSANYNLCVEGIDRIRQNHTIGMEECYLWIDYCCLNQDLNPVLELQELDAIMECCDCLLTPIVDIHTTANPIIELSSETQDSLLEWNIIPEKSSGITSLTEYQAEAWLLHLRRAWTRLEMFYGTNIPLSNATVYKLLNQNFNMELRYAVTQNRRPHFLFSTEHKQKALNPTCLSPIPNTFFERFHPLRGHVSVLTEKVQIERLVNDLKPYMTLVNHNLVGAKVAPKAERRKKGRSDKKWGRYVYASNDVYEGDLIGSLVQLRHGQGKMTYANGDIYNGEWYRDLRQGEGTLQYTTGSVYCGSFEDDKKHGIGKHTEAAAGLELWSYNGEWQYGKRCGQGRLVCVTGEEYEGGFKDNCFWGKGVQKYIDGSVYTGHFVDHKHHGYGRIVHSNGKVYCGDWQSGLYHGEGELELPTGDSYKGQYIKGVMSGRGRFVYASGESYEGEWENGEAHGVGIFRYNDGAVYEGECCHFVKEGLGKYTFASGSVYEGTWKGGMQHGKGTFRFSSGDVYTGDWLEDMMAGQGGTMSYSHGDVYTGEFVADMKCGQGTMRYSDGDVYEGQWQDDLFSGRGTFTYACGALYVGFWKLGLYDGYGWFVNSRGEESAGVWKEGQAVEKSNQFWTVDVSSTEDVALLCETAGKVKRQFKVNLA